MGRPKGPAAILPSAPAFSFGCSRASSPTIDKAPGPGAYGVPRLTSSSENLRSPGVGFGTSMRPAPYGSGRAPAPGAYDPRDRLVRSASPQFTFKGVSAKDHKVRNPSPGQYQPRVEADSAHSTAPAFSMAHRLAPPQSHSRQPAPNEYHPYRNSPYQLDKGLPVSLKFRHERTLTRAEVAPGPGEYPLPSSLQGPAFIIAAKLKPSKAEERAPGPAAYEVCNSTIGAAGKL